MSDLSATLDMSAVSEFTDLMPKHIFNAQRSAIRTTTTFANKEIVKRLAAATGLKAQLFKNHRIYSKTMLAGDGTRDEIGKVYDYYDPIKSRYLGAISENESEGGARAGSYFFEKTFAAHLGSTYSVFKRTGHARFPIKEQRMDLPQALPISQAVAAEAQAELQARFIEKLREYDTRLKNA